MLEFRLLSWDLDGLDSCTWAQTNSVSSPSVSACSGNESWLAFPCLSQTGHFLREMLAHHIMSCHDAYQCAFVLCFSSYFYQRYAAVESHLKVVFILGDHYNTMWTKNTVQKRKQVCFWKHIWQRGFRGNYVTHFGPVWNTSTIRWVAMNQL